MSSPQLSEAERRHWKVADLPENVRDEVLSSPSPLRSKNGASVAPPSESSGTGGLQMDPRVAYTIDNLFPELSKDRQRDNLHSRLRELGFLSRGTNLDNRFWVWMKRFNNEVADIVGIKENPERNEFEFCYTHRQAAQIEHYKDGTKAVRKYSCSRTRFCLWCRTRERKRLAREYFDLAVECYQKYGMDKVWTIVFTLPEDIEDKVGDKKERQKIRKEIAKLVKKAFGVKTRDNLGIIIPEHPVGNSDILRTRFHWHVIIFPLYIRNNSVYYANIDKLDNDFIRKEWDKILDKYFPDKESKATYPELKYYKFDTEKDKGRLLHRLNYDLRSFAIDVENKVLYHLADGGQLIVKGENRGGYYWRVLPVGNYAEHWLFITANNNVFSFGFIHTLGKWRELGFFAEPEQKEKKKPINTIPCTLVVVRRKVFNKKKRKFCWQRYEIARVWKDKKSYVDYLIGRDIPWA